MVKFHSPLSCDVVKKGGPQRTLSTVVGTDAGPWQTERDLVRSCVAGDQTAWRALYDRHYPDVDRLVMALGITDAEGDDLCQEIMLLVYRSLPSFRGESQLGSWIYRLATREAIRFAKRRRMRRRLSELFLRERKQRLPPDWAETEAGRRHYLQQILSRLSPERRMVLVLSEIEGLPVSEIARIADCAENTVWTRLHRARRDLAKIAEEGVR
jgi:RNA polymerase sigma-70 factor, ECF subfamily